MINLFAQHRRYFAGTVAVILAAQLFCVSASAILFGKKKHVEEPTDVAAIVLAQVYLDEMRLGQGVIDGRVGEFTRQAVAQYNTRWRLEADNWHRVLRDAGRNVKEPFTT